MRIPAGSSAHQITAVMRGHLAEASMAAQVMSRRLKDERDRQYLAVMRRALARSARVVDQLELYRRLTDEDELRTVLTEVDLVTLCRRTTEAAGELLKWVGVSLEFRTAELILPTRADGGQLNQMLYELIANGAAAMPGGGKLWVSLTKRERTAVITVGDEGDGLSEEALERLFGGESGQPDLSPEAGAGLGLPLARAVAEVHGGLFVVDTAPGGGVRAAVCIPLREEGRCDRLKSPSLGEDERPRALEALSGVLPIDAYLG